MKRAAVFFLMLCGSWAFAQWVETTIPVGRSPSAVCWQPVGNKVYVCCYGSREEPDSMLYVIDGVTNAVLDSVAVNPWGHTMAVSEQQNRVYVASYWGHSVAVVDCSTDSLVRVISTPDKLHSLAYDTAGQKLYAGGLFQVAVIDCTQDTIVALIDSVHAGAMEWEPRTNKLYCGAIGSESLFVVDGTADTLLAAILLGFDVFDICRNPHSNIVYVGSDAYYAQVALVDGAADTLVCIDTLGGNAVRMVYNTLADDLYCTLDYNKIVVVDGFTNQVVKYLNTRCNEGAAVCFNPTSNKVFSTNMWEDDIVYVIDGATRQLLGRLDVGHGPYACCCNPVNNRVYVADWHDNSITVVADTAVAGVSESFPKPAGLVPAATLCGATLRAERSGRLLDVTGSRVMDLMPGSNDVGSLSPGVYFMRASEEPDRAVRRILIPR